MQSDTINTSLPSPSDVTLESKVAFLRQPTSFPEPAYRVEAIETHMSWVFLTDGQAYKLKKPVRYEFLDFSTIKARRFYCEEELRLNRRLAADVYLGIAKLAIDASGQLHLEDDGTIVDWLIRMRRLPTHLMLDYAIKHGTADENDIARVASQLTGFYRTCAPVPIDADAYRGRFLAHINSGQRELSQPIYRLAVEQIDAVCEAQRTVLKNIATLFNERVRAARIVEGHGDLRPEHVCLNEELSIIDCLEFSRDLRIIDPADEISFLALECERLGAGALGRLLLQYYSNQSGDHPPDALIHFYQSYRAVLRAVITIRHLDEEKFRYSPEWPRRARNYLDLAQSHVALCQ